MNEIYVSVNISEIHHILMPRIAPVNFLSNIYLLLQEDLRILTPSVLEQFT